MRMTSAELYLFGPTVLSVGASVSAWVKAHLAQADARQARSTARKALYAPAHDAGPADPAAPADHVDPEKWRAAMHALIDRRMTEPARAPGDYRPPWEHLPCPECGVTWDTPNPACPAKLFDRHPLPPRT